MDKIEELVTPNPLEERNLLHDLDGVPPHVGYLVFGIRFELDHLPLDHIQTPVKAELLAFGEEDLKAETDAQIGFAALDRLPQQVNEAAFFQVGHTILEG